MSQLFRIILYVASAVGVLAALMTVAGTLMVAPATGAVGFVLAVAYAAAVIGVLRLSPMWPRGAGWVALALLWGGGVSIGLTMVSAPAIMQLVDASGWWQSQAAWGGAYPEEIAKALGVVFVCMAFRQLNRPWHALMVGAIVGLGFETFENLLYGSVMGMMHSSSDWAGFWQTWALRLVAGPFLHIIFTALAGWGIGWALFAASRSFWWRAGAAALWLGIAFALHFGWNYLASDYVFVAKNLLLCLILYPLAGWVAYRGTRLARAGGAYAYVELSPRT